MFAFALDPEITNYTVFDVSDRLRERGWLVPPTPIRRTARIWPCCASWSESGMTYDMADRLLEDMRQRTADLESLDEPLPDGATSREQRLRPLRPVRRSPDRAVFLHSLNPSPRPGPLPS